MPDITPPPFKQAAFYVWNKHNPAVVDMYLILPFMDEKEQANAALAKATGHAQQLRDAYEILREFNILLTPVNPRVGNKHPETSADVDAKMDPTIGATFETCQFNLIGHPALSMPVGWVQLLEVLVGCRSNAACGEEI
jgi:amidase